MLPDERRIDAVLQILVNAASFGDELDPMDLWEAIEEDPSDYLTDEEAQSVRNWSS